MKSTDNRWEPFGRWIRELRIAADLTQEEAAKRAQVVRQQWNRIEKGESGTRRDTVPRIALAIGANVAEVYERAGYTPPVGSDLDEAFAEEIVRMVRCVSAGRREIYKQKLRMDAQFLMSLVEEAA